MFSANIETNYEMRTSYVISDIIYDIDAVF